MSIQHTRVPSAEHAAAGGRGPAGLPAGVAGVAGAARAAPPAPAARALYVCSPAPSIISLFFI